MAFYTLFQIYRQNPERFLNLFFIKTNRKAEYVMKKKLLSLLLVIVVMMTSVSVGFGSIVANAGAAGGGVEGINAFNLRHFLNHFMYFRNI